MFGPTAPRSSFSEELGDFAFVSWHPPSAAVEAPSGVSWPPGVDTILDFVQSTWPEDVVRATRIVFCESMAGQHQDTYNLDTDNGGPMQINWYTWAGYFESIYGWSWEQIVTDLPTHFQAARHIYDRAGSWAPWGCY